MGSSTRSKLDKLAFFLFEDSGTESSPESLKRFEINLAEQLERAKKASKKTWISRAQAGRKDFSESVQNLVSQLKDKYGSRADLIAAIQAGLLGQDIQSRYALQFRNRKIDELSDEDLKAILADKEILSLLEEVSRKTKK